MLLQCLREHQQPKWEKSARWGRLQEQNLASVHHMPEGLRRDLWHPVRT